jgi:class 3 adenylate cyclase
MTTKSVLATLFADIAGSCGIYESLGDEAGRDLVSRCISELRDVAESHTGRMVKTIGDEIMCTFPTAQKAGEAAIAMQTRTESFSADESPIAVAVRIGFHFGQVVEEDGGDVVGDSVNVAARLVQYAKAKQIITSWETLELIDIVCPHRELDRVRLRGREQIVTICEILWKHDVTTTISASEFTEKLQPHKQLVVQLGDQTSSVGETKFKITIGRDPTSDIQVHSKKASRNHATLEYRRGTFVLSDISTNATYLRQGLEETRLHREQMPIFGSGQISLGVPFDKDPEEIIELTPSP